MRVGDAEAEAQSYRKRVKHLETQVQGLENDVAEGLTREQQLAQQVEQLTGQVKRLEQDEQDIADAAAASEKQADVEKTQLRESAAKAQAETGLMKNALQKVIDQFNILSEGVKIAQSKGAFSLEVASHMHTAITTTTALFEQKRDAK